MSLSNRLTRRIRRQEEGERKATIGKRNLQIEFITPIIESHDSQTQDSRVKEGYLHVSSLLRFCPRMFRLAAIDQVRVTDFPRSSDRLLWAIGRAVEKHIRNAVGGSVDASELVGVWRCPCGTTEHSGAGEGNLVCNSCKKPVNRYGELTVWNHDLKIAGNPDLLWELTEGQHVVEIKSINKKEFDALKGPKPDHVFQASVYNRLQKDAGVRVTDSVTILYGCKDYAFQGTPYKEYSVPANQLENVINNVFEQVRLMRRDEQMGRIPERLSACSSPDTPIAKQCPLLCSCFSRK